ncbi:MAG TPA: hypothetical protein DD706_01115 [Nitrospiraceae bacterium]|nr:hypothetical protein [Nitrospiraceae bacterium]
MQWKVGQSLGHVNQSPSSLNTNGGLGTDSSPVAQNDNSVENSDAFRPAHDRTLLFLTGLCEPPDSARHN